MGSNPALVLWLLTLGQSLPSEWSLWPLEGEQHPPQGAWGWGQRSSSAGPAPAPLTPVSAGIAKACEQNLKKTLRFGGRLELPGSMELRAMLVSVGGTWGGGRPTQRPLSRPRHAHGGDWG